VTTPDTRNSEVQIVDHVVNVLHELDLMLLPSQRFSDRRFVELVRFAEQVRRSLRVKVRNLDNPSSAPLFPPGHQHEFSFKK
jgi:hypothetical protein